MNEFRIEVYHPSLDILSDRSFRYILKRISRLVREIQLREVLDEIDSFDISDPEKQSLRDKLKFQIETLPAYYVEKVERGSLEVVVVATAAAYWLLDKTIGESVSDAYKESAIHQKIIQILSTPLGRKRLPKIAEEVSKEINLGRFLIDESKLDVAEEVTTLRLNLQTVIDQRERVESEPRLDERLVVKQASDKIKDSEPL